VDRSPFKRLFHHTLRAVQGTVEEEAAAEDQGLLGRFIDYIQVWKTCALQLLCYVGCHAAQLLCVFCSLLGRVIDYIQVWKTYALQLLSFVSCHAVQLLCFFCSLLGRFIHYIQVRGWRHIR
jgi:hypothetical protein